MKRLLLTLICTACYVFSLAQWRNTSNAFIDDNHIPASIASNDQAYPISTISYPDSSIIIAWRDMRNGNRDIYAQKFDKNGVAKWAVNGAPVATGSENQAYYTGGINYEPAFYSFMATDSSGGFLLPGKMQILLPATLKAKYVCSMCAAMAH